MKNAIFPSVSHELVYHRREHNFLTPKSWILRRRENFLTLFERFCDNFFNKIAIKVVLREYNQTPRSQKICRKLGNFKSFPIGKSVTSHPENP